MLFRDYFDASSTKIPVAGKNLYILGRATDGPLYEPINVARQRDILRIFESGELVDAALESLRIGGADLDLYLVRIGGSYATEFLGVADENETVVAAHLRSKYAGTKYNGIQINRDMQHLYFSTSDAIETISIGYRWDDYPTLGLLAEAINNDTRRGRNFVYVNSLIEHLHSRELIFSNPNIVLSQGNNGELETDEELYNSFKLGYLALEGRIVDYIMPVGVYFDGIDGRLFHLQLLEFCDRQCKISTMPHGIVGVKLSQSNITSTEYYQNLMSNIQILNRVGINSTPETDHGMYLSIVAGEYFHDNRYKSLAPVYAAMVASAAYPKNIVMKPVDIELRFEFTGDQIQSLSNHGVSTMRNSVYTQTAVIASAVTAALPNMESHHLLAVAGLQASIHAMRNVLSQILGESTLDTVKIRDIETRAIKELRILRNNGVISDYRMNSVYYPVTDHMVVHWDVQPINSVQFMSMNCDIAFRRS